MTGITVDQLRLRYQRLDETRQQEQRQYDELGARLTGYKYVLGELEAMIAELEAQAWQPAETPPAEGG